MASRWMQQKLQRQKAHRNKLNGACARFAIIDKVAIVGVDYLSGKSAAPDYDPRIARVQKRGDYTPTPGKGGRVISQRTYGNGERRWLDLTSCQTIAPSKLIKRARTHTSRR